MKKSFQKSRSHGQALPLSQKKRDRPPKKHQEEQPLSDIKKTRSNEQSHSLSEKKRDRHSKKLQEKQSRSGIKKTEQRNRTSASLDNKSHPRDRSLPKFYKKQPPRFKKDQEQKSRPDIRKGKEPLHVSHPSPSHALENKILFLLRIEPLNLPTLRQQLQLKASEEPKIISVLKQLEQEKLLVRIRGDHYIVPRAADLILGKLQVHKSGAAHVISEDQSSPDLYISPENMGTGMHGDEVLARLIKDRRSDRGSTFRERPGSREGCILRVLERANKTIVGTLQCSENFYYVVADDPRFPHNLSVVPPSTALSARSGDKVVASLDRWENRHNNPEGTIIEVLGAANAPGVDILSIIRKHQLPIEFPEEVLKEAASHGSSIDAKDLKKREDLRDRFIITIDLDDAIEVEVTPSGWNASIHIADVAHYVPPHSPLDKEARARGNSVYLVDRVIPMLPE